MIVRVHLLALNTARRGRILAFFCLVYLGNMTTTLGKGPETWMYRYQTCYCTDGIAPRPRNGIALCYIIQCHCWLASLELSMYCSQVLRMCTHQRMVHVSRADGVRRVVWVSGTRVEEASDIPWFLERPRARHRHSFGKTGT